MALTNTAPVADDDAFTVQQGLRSTSLSGNLGVGDGVGIDHDPDGDALGWAVAPVSLDNAFFSDGQLRLVTITKIYGGGGAPTVFTVMSMPTAAGGTVTIRTNGDFSYQSPAGFSGVDWFDYTLVDAQLATDIGRVTIDVQPTAGANNRPVAAADVFAGAEDQRITGNLLADNGSGADFDPDGNALTVANGTIRTAAGGIVSIFVNGDFTYTPRANYGGTDSFTYTLRDGQGATSTATVTLDVTAVNDAPIAGNDAFAGPRGQPISGNVMANDRDAEGDSLQVAAATITRRRPRDIVERWKLHLFAGRQIRRRRQLPVHAARQRRRQRGRHGHAECGEPCAVRALRFRDGCCRQPGQRQCPVQ